MRTEMASIRQPTLQMRVLQQATKLLGGEHALSRRLHAPSSDLSRWLRGDGQPPKTILLAAIDIVLEKSEGSDQAVKELRSMTLPTNSSTAKASKGS
jgi:hypothetical protein